MHLNSTPAILYFGTPVVLISTLNEDGSYNLAPMSSIFWLGWRCMIGLGTSGKTAQNILRTGECVLNLPSVNQVEAVNLLAKTTGVDPVPPLKFQRGYRYEREKFDLAGLTPVASETVLPPRVLECPVQLEAVLEGTHGLAQGDPALSGKIITFELRMQRVHLEESILMDGNPNRVDPDKWRPLIMSFQEFYGLGDKVHYSTLAEIPEALYETKDLEKARTKSVTVNG
ncbi:NADH-FMN oxidoreductase RutF, flavin reductase (DIM6/NTAB) family [Chitinophaga sp. CF118]|uniref:flavin reductase family protein n=1 Tax=Chitinophaga sp. CF118 TaxID=1884367 RepID=UPI0008EBD899|nr:flavin reductase family protein [Chitinophaga sp. CF118]SFD46622.1 NADH-FMN oxidoreductase RutF, flavin reductase (DIM6/NTAB) family [Chitinophaga sp. CF118]